MTKAQVLMPKHIWDGKKKEKQKKDIEKVPKPTGYRLVLFPLKLESKTAGGIHLTDAVIEQASVATNVCKVIEVGPDAYLDKNKFPNGAWCKKNDWIIIAKYAGSRVSIDGGELRIINDDEVLAVVEDPRDILPANLI
jgi:chaperonin GroES|tara:strand:- start:834 stop:1247 length:414 start_codon:yes stop_codon:yes gene_type:complete